MHIKSLRMSFIGFNMILTIYPQYKSMWTLWKNRGNLFITAKVSTAIMDRTMIMVTIIIIIELSVVIAGSTPNTKGAVSPASVLPPRFTTYGRHHN